MARPAKYDDGDILDRAMRVAWRDGWARTSIRDLERALDLKAPSIYRRFGSKDALGVAVVDHYVERVIRRRVAKYLPGSGDPIVNLTGFLERSVTEAADGGGLWGCLLTTAALEVDPTTPGIVEAVGRGLELIEAGIRSEVERAEAAGLLRSGLGPAEATSVLATTMQGLMAMARGGADPGGLRLRARAAVSVVAATGADG